MTKNIRNLALATMSGFRHKTVDVPEWEGATVVLRVIRHEINEGGSVR